MLPSQLKGTRPDEARRTATTYTNTYNVLGGGVRVCTGGGQEVGRGVETVCLNVPK